MDPCRGARQHELRRMIRVSQSVVERHEASERGAEDDRVLDPEHIAERP